MGSDVDFAVPTASQITIRAEYERDRPERS
jgi:hypothetical protein